MKSPRSRNDIERIKTLYEGKGEGRAPFWSPANWGPLIPEIQFGEGQFRDLLIEAMRKHGFGTADMVRLSVVELGCGWGRNLHQFVELGIPARNIAGVDLIAQFIAFGQSQNPALKIAVGDATRTDLADSAFDVVLLHTVLSAIADRHLQAKLLREARRLVKPGGLVIIFDIADSYPVGRTNVSGENIVFIQPVARASLCAIAADAGLAIRKWRRSGLMPRPRKLIFRLMPGNFLWRRALATLVSFLPGANSHYFMIFVPEKRT